MLHFYISTELKSFGYTEDGEEFIGEIYFITAEDKDGNKWEHGHTFSGVKVGQDEEYGINWFEDVRPEAKENSNILLERIKKSGITDVSDRVHWSLGRPAYGSLAYQAYGQYNDWLEDKKI
jgi:hypothetical protein